MSISKVELTKQLKGLGIKITGGCIRKSDILKLFEAHAVSPKANMEEKKEIARYLWFVVKSDGTLESGFEYNSDGKDYLKEVKEWDKGAKLIHRSKVDPIKLATFFKAAGVPPRMLDKGYRDAKKDAKGIGASIVSNEHYQRMLDDVADALLEAEEDLKKAVDSYSDMENDDPAMEKKIERLELERDRAKKSYENALEVTLDDLRKESAYETWKEAK